MYFIDIIVLIFYIRLCVFLMFDCIKVDMRSFIYILLNINENLLIY